MTEQNRPEGYCSRGSRQWSTTQLTPTRWPKSLRGRPFRVGAQPLRTPSVVSHVHRDGFSKGLGTPSGPQALLALQRPDEPTLPGVSDGAASPAPRAAAANSAKAVRHHSGSRSKRAYHRERVSLDKRIMRKAPSASAHGGGLGISFSLGAHRSAVARNPVARASFAMRWTAFSARWHEALSGSNQVTGCDLAWTAHQRAGSDGASASVAIIDLDVDMCASCSSTRRAMPGVAL